jgi:hypothetical protein
LLLKLATTTTLRRRAEAEEETMRRSSGRKLDTTLGELISAVSDAALEVCDDKDTAYLLASIALEDMFENGVQSGKEPRRRRRPSCAATCAAVNA